MTISRPVTVEGVGLQTGQKAAVTMKGSPADSGINFIRTDLPDKPLTSLSSFDLGGLFKGRRTTVGLKGAEVQTIEHLMACLSALSIDNIVIELSASEMPGLDGSAKCFYDALKQAGPKEQDKERKELVVKTPEWYQEGDCVLAAFPGNELRLSCLISYPDASIGTQFLSLALNEENFEKEIAPARTFCLEKEALALLKQGFGKGANYENTLVMGRDGPVGNALRFPDEPVRHKMLDLIGDLYLLGHGLKAHVVAIKGGHRQNMELVKKLKETLLSPGA
ncbi:UDP-3-O-acyl-N-acetylglucosamine deacetylase [Candidatus Omnitrophota bacterium]